MFRSLLISFLILSALASQGAGVQFNPDIELSADMLLQLYNAATAQADRLTESASAKAEGSFCADARKECSSYEILLRQTGRDSHFICFVPSAQDSELTLQCCRMVQSANQSLNAGTISCGSDSSPPCCL